MSPDASSSRCVPSAGTYAPKMIERIAPYVIAVIGAPLLVLPSLLIPTKVDSPAEARAAAYGYPFHFVSSRIEILPGALGGASREEELCTAYPSVEPFNRWENPTSGDGGGGVQRRSLNAPRRSKRSSGPAWSHLTGHPPRRFAQSAGGGIASITQVARNEADTSEQMLGYVTEPAGTIRLTGEPRVRAKASRTR